MRKQSEDMIVKTFLQVIPAMLIPFTIIYGILGGVFTPTESACNCMCHCIYYRDLRTVN